jgi:protein TonB
MRWWMTLGAVLFLACGGSGDSEPSAPAPASAAAEPDPAPAPASAPAPVRPLSATPPPAPPPPPLPLPAPQPTKIKIVKETVQPMKIEKPVEVDYDEEYPGEEGGVEGGAEGGVMGGEVGEVGGVVADAPPPPPPPSPSQIVPQVAIQANLISGEKAIAPDDATKKQIASDGKSRLVFTLKLCIDSKGAPSSVTFIRTSGYPAYDQKVRTAVKAWKFRPFMVNGKPTAVCAAYTFIYNQTN